MEFIQLSIPDVILIKPTVFEDHRGLFMELYHIDKFNLGGIKCNFVQDNHARSVYNTLRGLHFQVKYPQAKLLRCLMGKVFDVAVDIRQDSPNYGQWVGEEISEDNKGNLALVYKAGPEDEMVPIAQLEARANGKGYSNSDKFTELIRWSTRMELT